jgi:uncharacterized protein (DUF2141 family)
MLAAVAAAMLASSAAAKLGETTLTSVISELNDKIGTVCVVGANDGAVVTADRRSEVARTVDGDCGFTQRFCVNVPNQLLSLGL